MKSYIVSNDLSNTKGHVVSVDKRFVTLSDNAANLILEQSCQQIQHGF